jgi:hypothetical protein
LHRQRKEKKVLKKRRRRNLRMKSNLRKMRRIQEIRIMIVIFSTTIRQTRFSRSLIQERRLGVLSRLVQLRIRLTSLEQFKKK